MEDKGNFSMTVQGLVLTIASLIIQAFRLDIDQALVNDLVQNIVHIVVAVTTIVGLAQIYIGRVRMGDITWYGKRISS